MADYGLRISYSGDVKSVGDKDCAITSKYALLKGSLSGSGTQAGDGDTALYTIQIEHNLGYVPFAQVFVDDVFSGEMQHSPFQGFNGDVLEIMSHRCDTTKLYITVYVDDFGVGGEFSVDYKYFIYLDKGKL